MLTTAEHFSDERNSLLQSISNFFFLKKVDKKEKFDDFGYIGPTIKKFEIDCTFKHSSLQPNKQKGIKKYEMADCVDIV